MQRFVFSFFATLVLVLNGQNERSNLEDDGSRVSVLGYHDFTTGTKLTSMLTTKVKFRSQMETLKKTGVPFITLEQFLKWRRGEGQIPAQAYLITIDDGWKSVYTTAYPILKEMEIPFTIYLYKNYVGSHCGGKAMSYDMINEMLESGYCTIGSHSVSHPYPSKVKKHKKNGAELFNKFIKFEFGDSKSFLEERFGRPVTTYAYPGGFYEPEMYPIAEQLGYDHLFTCKPGKINLTTDKFQLPRYIVHGDHDGAFNASMVFRNGARLSGGGFTDIELPHPAKPGPGHISPSRLPRISADLSKIEGLDPESIVMRVGGFGKVPAVLNPETKEIAWTVNRPLRQLLCEVSVQWKLKGNTKYEPLMKWSFAIDHVSSYQSQ